MKSKYFKYFDFFLQFSISFGTLYYPFRLFQYSDHQIIFKQLPFLKNTNHASQTTYRFFRQCALVSLNILENNIEDTATVHNSN